MTGTEYQKEVLTVECQYPQDVQDRLVKMAKWLAVHVTCIKSEAEHLDKLKKHVYYNRQNGLQDVDPAPFADEAMNQRLRDNVRLLHHIIGVITETAELADTVLDHVFNGTPLDTVNIVEEFGDIGFYTAGGVDSVGHTLDEVFERNIEKLVKTRYKGGYTNDKANNRDLDTERQVLEAIQKENVG